MDFLPFVLFVIVMTGTPGPGNLTMMAIGQTAGYRAALPFLSGTLAGCVVLDTCVALGLGTLFMTSETAATIMKFVGMGYMLYLAWKVLRMQIVEPENVRPFSFVEGLFLHPTSPKTWAMAVVGFSQFTNPSEPMGPQIVIFVLTFFMGALTFHSLWCLAGATLLRFLRADWLRTCTNVVLAASMVGATGYAMLM